MHKKKIPKETERYCNLFLLFLMFLLHLSLWALYFLKILQWFWLLNMCNHCRTVCYSSLWTHCGCNAGKVCASCRHLHAEWCHASLFKWSQNVPVGHFPWRPTDMSMLKVWIANPKLQTWPQAFLSFKDTSPVCTVKS